MSNVPIQIENTIKEYLSIISKMIPIDKAILFGSYAKGNYNEESDVDLAIFSSSFNNQNRIESFRLLFLEAMNFSIDLQPQPFTKDDLLNPEGIVKEIFRTGIEMKMRSVKILGSWLFFIDDLPKYGYNTNKKEKNSIWLHKLKQLVLMV